MLPLRKQLRNRHYWWIKNSSLFSHGKEKDLKTVFIVSLQIVSQRACPSAYICPVLSRIIMETRSFKLGKIPRPVPTVTDAQSCQVTFLYLPRHSNYRFRAVDPGPLPFSSALSYFFTYLIYFSLYKQTRKDILLKPFTNLQKYKKSSILVPFSHHAFLSHKLAVALSGTLFQPCLPHRFHIFFTDLSFPQARVKGSVPIATVHTCVTIIASLLFSEPLENSVS